MQPRRPHQRRTRAVAASFLAAVAVTAISGAGVTANAGADAAAATAPKASPAPCEAWTGGGQPPDPGGTDHNNYLSGVAVLSPCNAWAVGEYEPTQTLIAHWDGTAWTQVPSPDPGTEASLRAVAPVSPSDIWAVGEYNDGTALRTLIVHWNGAAWKQVPSPNVSGTTVDNLVAVRATSATDVWAVGSYTNSNNVSQTLIVHWDGSAWKQVKTPNPGGSAQNNDLMAVAVTPGGDAWAAGQFATGTGMRTLVLHLDGSAWRWEPTQSFGDSVIDDTVTAVGASPDSSSVWAVGSYYTSTGYQTFAIHCC